MSYPRCGWTESLPRSQRFFVSCVQYRVCASVCIAFRLALPPRGASLCSDDVVSIRALLSVFSPLLFCFAHIYFCLSTPYLHSTSLCSSPACLACLPPLRGCHCICSLLNTVSSTLPSPPSSSAVEMHRTSCVAMLSSICRAPFFCSLVELRARPCSHDTCA